jgi:hypothetical protein
LDNNGIRVRFPGQISLNQSSHSLAVSSAPAHFQHDIPEQFSTCGAFADLFEPACYIPFFDLPALLDPPGNQGGGLLIVSEGNAVMTNATGFAASKPYSPGADAAWFLAADQATTVDNCW